MQSLYSISFPNCLYFYAWKTPAKPPSIWFITLSVDYFTGLEQDVCWIDCPIDCQMSSWSDWTECNVPCGQGFRERKRHVLVEGNEIGRPCPKTVNKTVSFLKLLVFTWKMSQRKANNHCLLKNCFNKLA